MRKVMPTQKSWSEICRNRITSYTRQINKGEGSACIAWATDNLRNSYRPLIFRYRCAKMLRRAIRFGKIEERSEAVKEYRDYVNEIIEIYGFDARFPN